jgi:hypothetical protein
MVVYHGTRAAWFRKFAPELAPEGVGDKFTFSDLGLHFTNDAPTASRYADLTPMHDRAAFAPGVYPVYLSMQRPVVFEDYSVLDTAIRRARGAGALKRKFQRQGHDGFVVQRSEGRTDFIVFDSRQVKSAIGNRGTFDPSDPDILAGIRHR